MKRALDFNCEQLMYIYIYVYRMTYLIIVFSKKDMRGIFKNIF